MKNNLFKAFAAMLLVTVCASVFAADVAGTNQPMYQATPQAKQRPDTFADKAILYVPNRLLDFTDIIDMSIGFGPSVKVNVWTTRFFWFGGGIGGSSKIGKWYNRQYGACLESSWNASFMMLTAENTEITDNTSAVQKYFEYNMGVPSIGDSVYNFWTGPRDIFSIGAQGAVFGEFDCEVHPFAIVNFVTGFFFVDLKGDTITMQDFRN